MTDTVPPDIIINAILVQERVRPGFLIQHYELSPDVLAFLKQAFPDLKQSTEYETYQGAIISRTNYNGRNDITPNTMGRIIGYPCANEYEDLNLYGSGNFNAELFVMLGNGEHIQLIANICSTEKNASQFNKIAEKARAAIKIPKYAHYFTPYGGIRTIYAKVETRISQEDLIHALSNLTNAPLSNAMKRFILDTLFYNYFEFATDDPPEIINWFQDTNPIHRGMLLSIAIQSSNNSLELFFPHLNSLPQDMRDKMENNTEVLRNNFVKALEQTYNPELPKAYDDEYFKAVADPDLGPTPDTDITTGGYRRKKQTRRKTRGRRHTRRRRRRRGPL